MACAACCPSPQHQPAHTTMRLLPILVLLAIPFVLANLNATGSNCGGNCPGGNCPSCPCGTSPSKQASVCSQFSGWDQTCCQCIVSHESGGNANADNYNTNGSFDVGVWQINQNNWGSCSGGSAPCAVSANLQCAVDVWKWGGGSFKLWSTCGGCNCCSPSTNSAATGPNSGSSTGNSGNSASNSGNSGSNAAGSHSSHGGSSTGGNSGSTGSTGGSTYSAHAVGGNPMKGGAAVPRDQDVKAFRL